MFDSEEDSGATKSQLRELLASRVQLRWVQSRGLYVSRSDKESEKPHPMIYQRNNEWFHYDGKKFSSEIEALKGWMIYFPTNIY